MKEHRLNGDSLPANSFKGIVMEKGIKVVSISDTHLGLKTDDIDRTEEIVGLLTDAVEKANSLQEEGFDTFLVFNGDILNDNDPSEKLIAELISIMNLIKKYEIKTYWVVGNHESVFDPDRLSCLSFIKKAKVGYPTITLMDDIATRRVGQFDSGDVYFTFLPHITSATLEKHRRDGKDYKSVKSYIEKKCTSIVTKLGKGVTHYVFSHLNVSGSHPGSEENLLKKSEAYLPAILTNTPIEFTKPTIIQAHIHSEQVIGNVHIIGSPVFCGFGERGPKYYATIEISKSMGVKDKIELITSNYRPFLQLELSMIGETNDFFDLEPVQEFWNEIVTNKDRKPIVKFDVTINAENNSYDWNEIRKKIMRLIDGVYVKPILPRVITKKHVRSVNQKLGLTPKEAVKVYLRRNLKQDPERAKRIFNKTKKYLEA